MDADDVAIALRQDSVRNPVRGKAEDGLKITPRFLRCRGSGAAISFNFKTWMAICEAGGLVHEAKDLSAPEAGAKSCLVLANTLDELTVCFSRKDTEKLLLLSTVKGPG